MACPFRWASNFSGARSIEAKVAKPIASFAEYALRGIYPQAQSSVNQNNRSTAWSLWKEKTI